MSYPYRKLVLSSGSFPFFLPFLVLLLGPSSSDSSWISFTFLIFKNIFIIIDVLFLLLRLFLERIEDLSNEQKKVSEKKDF